VPIVLIMFAYNIQKSSATQYTAKSALQVNSNYYRYTNNLGKEFHRFLEQLYPNIVKLETAITEPFKELGIVPEACVYQGNIISDVLSTADLYVLADQDFEANLVAGQILTLLTDTKLFLTSVKSVLRVNSEAAESIQTILEFFSKLDSLRSDLIKAFLQYEDDRMDAFESGRLDSLLERSVKLMMKFQKVIIRLRNVELFFAISEEQLGKVIAKKKSSQSHILSLNEIMELGAEIEERVDCIEQETEIIRSISFEEDSQTKVT
jgi:hypothetical protein